MSMTYFSKCSIIQFLNNFYMRAKKISFRATPQILMELNHVSKIAGETRSTVIRSIIINYLNKIFSYANDI